MRGGEPVLSISLFDSERLDMNYNFKRFTGVPGGRNYGAYIRCEKNGRIFVSKQARDQLGKSIDVFLDHSEKIIGLKDGSTFKLYGSGSFCSSSLIEVISARRGTVINLSWRDDVGMLVGRWIAEESNK